MRAPGRFLTFTPDDQANYHTVTHTKDIVVQLAPTTVTWASPANIVYGTPLGATQLNATASVPGRSTTLLVRELFSTRACIRCTSRSLRQPKSCRFEQVSLARRREAHACDHMGESCADRLRHGTRLDAVQRHGRRGRRRLDVRSASSATRVSQCGRRPDAITCERVHVWHSAQRLAPGRHGEYPGDVRLFPRAGNSVTCR